MNYRNNKAVILSDCGKIKNFLLYQQVYECRKVITEFLQTCISEPHQCVGLQMTHNIYIPSIILSLQDLQYAFIFLPEEETEANLILKELKISWILSFTSCEKCVATLSLNDQSLGIKKFLHDEIKIYKDIYYIIRTSGTTGQNKFVKVGKYSIESNIKSLSKIFDIRETDVIYFGTPLTFDPSMIELLLALHNGACLLITPPKNRINSTHLYQTLFHPENGITVLQIVPSLFLRWSQEQTESILLNEKLKILAFGGEAFPKSVLRYKRSENLRVFNLYGVTELSCWATIYEVPNQEIDDVPVGNSLEDTIIEIRDFSGNKVAEGEGEIYLGSKNRICFVDRESNDDEVVFRATGDVAIVNKEGIFYKYRKNDVFKRLGHKLHLSKIEELVQKETGLPNKCIWSKSESKLLLFLIIGNFEKTIKNKFLDKIRIKLLHSLPKQYFPDYVDIIRKCPVTSHGKTNKKLLESIYLTRNHPNKNPVDVLKTLLCESFGLDDQQLSDFQKSSFFELGGTSILAIQILDEFKNETGTECPDLPTALFQKDISACIECARLVKATKRCEIALDSAKNTVKKFKSDIELTIAWRYNLEACVDASALLFEHNGQVFAAVGSFAHIFVVLNAETGAEVAKFLLPDVIEGSPGLSPCHNFLYVGCFDGCLYCLDFINNAKKWVYAASDRIKSKPVLCQNSTAIVFGSYDKHIHCIQIDGAPVWKTHVDESVICTPLIQEGRIYVATICGTCVCLCEKSGEVLWKYKSKSPIFGTPCMFKNIIVWPNVEGRLLSLTLDGEKVQEFKCGGHLYSSLISSENFVIFGCQDCNLYILESDDGVLKTKLIVNLEDALTTPCIYKGRIAVAGNSGNFFLTDLEGKLLSNLRLPGEIFSSVAAYENIFFLGCRDNHFYCIESGK